MEVSFSQSFLTDLERIDNKIVITDCVLDSETSYHPEVVCHENVMQVCIVDVGKSVCNRLDFYYNDEIAFTITDSSTISLSQYRTIFMVTLPQKPKAVIECPWITEDTKFLESIGQEFGCSFYKDIKISNDSLVWKESLNKYSIDRGIQDNHSYDVELFDTKSGSLEERAIKFKSYQNITIKQGNWRVDTIKRTSIEKHDVYSGISDSSFLVWDSPMIDSKVNLSITPNCIDNIGKYVDPGEVIYGNTDCFQYTKYQSSLRGFRVTGTEGTRFEVLFNRESIRGNYTSYSGVIGEEGKVEIKIPEDLPYYHFNGIVAIGPSRVTSLETIMYLEEVIEEYVPNPDKTYVVDLNNTKVDIDVDGVCEYIEYEKYLGKITEIGRGEESIRSIPGLSIDLIETGGLNASIDSQCKQIIVNQTTSTGSEVYYNTYQASISNNIEVNGNTMSTSQLLSDYKIRIEQVGTIWKIQNSPNYINNSDQIGIYLLGYEINSRRVLKLMTNDTRATSYTIPEVILGTQTNNLFTFYVSSGSYSYIDGERWMIYNLTIIAKSQNDENSWRPQDESGNPYLVKIRYNNIERPSLFFYLIQLKKIENEIEVWEETLFPGKFSYADSITILNSLVKSIVITKKSDTALNWYYYDINNTNKFYITNPSSMVTNTGLEYLISNDTQLLDLGTGEEREIYSRVINVNRSDQIGSLGVLTITESSSYPESWRDLIDNNTINIEVSRELDNIYIQVGTFSGSMKNEDLEVSVNRIGLFSLYVRSNFKYVIQTFGNLKIYYNNSTLLDQQYVFNGYSNDNLFEIALLKLDEESSIDDSYVEIRSGSVVRKVTLKVVGPEKYHDFCFENIEKPNIIRILENGSFVPGLSNSFLYRSTTTPSFNFVGLNKTNYITNPVFDDYTSSGYSHHESIIPISVQNSRSLSYSKYPMKSFGSIQESSLSYSSGEAIESSGVVGALEYLFYMKGKKHYLWCVESLDGLSSIYDPSSGNITKNMFLDANGENEVMIYVVSRYSAGNRTFITEQPKKNEFKLSLNELEASIKISPQQKIELDEMTQIEYAIPISVKCNVENNNGNVYLGGFEYSAITRITEDSIGDVIVVSDDIITKEGINVEYIKTHIISDNVQDLKINIYQKGTSLDILDEYYCDIPDKLGIDRKVMYFVPQIGNNIIIENVLSGVSVVLGGSNTCTINSEFGSGYFLVTLESLDIIEEDGQHWYSSESLPTGIIEDTNYEVSIIVNYGIPVEREVIDPETGEHSIVTEIDHRTKVFKKEFIKFGCDCGFYIEGMTGFGNMKSNVDDYSDIPEITVSSDGGKVFLHAGIFYAMDGVGSTEALRVPAKYEFIGNNLPTEVYWEDGNLDDGGNLCVVVPPRLRDDYGNKDYILHVTQPDEYRPLNLYVKLSQASIMEPTPDTGQLKYKIEFHKEMLEIYSNGTINGEDDKIYFSHNLNQSIFDRVRFRWVAVTGSTIPTAPDDLTELEEIERSCEKDIGYVRFRFKPNGSEHFISAKIQAVFDTGSGIVIGELPVKMGFYSLSVMYKNPYLQQKEGSDYSTIWTPLSRISFKPAVLLINSGNKMYTNYRSPCKSESNNSNATLDVAGGRGVFYLRAKKQEFYDNSYTELQLSDVYNDVELVGLYPSGAFDSSGVSYNSDSSVGGDYDAYINPNYNNGSSNVTGFDFSYSSSYPYVEFSYQVKDEYVRERLILSEFCKIKLADLDVGNIAEFFLSTVSIKRASDELDNIDNLEFSSYNLKFDCKGGYKQVSFSPASFKRNVVTLVGVNEQSPAPWVTIQYTTGRNFIGFTAAENMSSTSYYRTIQAKVEVYDPKDLREIEDISPIKIFYINIEQEAYSVRIPESVNIKLLFQNEANGSVPITGEVLLEVGGGSVWANLGNADGGANIMTLASQEISPLYDVECTESGGVYPEEYLGENISGVKVYTFDGTTHTDSLIDAEVFSYSDDPQDEPVLNPPFENGGSYRIHITGYNN